MILLVAITVVLAAVLYVLVSHYSSGGADTTPIGYSLGLGPVQEATGTKSTASYCATNHPCYGVAIASVDSSVTLGSMNFVVKTSSGTTRTVQSGSARISIVASNGGVLASTVVKKNSPFDVTAWSSYLKGYSSHSPLSGTDTIWVQFGDPKLHPTGEGFVLNVLGTGSFSGTEHVALP